MYRRLIILLSGVLFFLVSALIIAQDEPKDMLYMVHKDVIKANKVTQYEKAVNELYEQFKIHNFGMQIQFASSNDENEYFYLTPINSYADLDKADAIWDELYKKAGEETMSAIDKQFEGCYEHHNNYVIRFSTELSYIPENPRLKPEDANFRHWDYYQVEEGKEQQAMELAKKFKELWTKNNVGDGYTVAIADIGHDLGLMVVVQSAKSAVDFYQQSEKLMETMGDEINKLNDEFMKLTRDFRHVNGKPHPEWVYTPSE
ncbi:MAG: hypothetical protein O6940_04700 [Ignavibacteria bacterium]|nr:hypothetical protein [Ignavibacteria bacterium]